MTAILDPHYSRPIDVHRWSEHPEVAGWVETIWTNHFADMAGTKTGPKPKTPFKDQLKVLILDLYVAWLEDPELCIGVSMSVNSYDTRSRYNALHISKHIIKVIHRLKATGHIVIAKGSYGGPGAEGNRTTRIRASDALRKVFQGSRVTRDDITRIEAQECVILRDLDEQPQEYEDTDETNRQREELRAYNLVLANHFIDVGSLDQPRLVTGQDRGRDQVQPIDHNHHFIRRIYSRGDWGCNGRFHIGWWQSIGSTYRADILINDTPTVEVDFKGLHLQILGAEQGVELQTDPYELPERTVPGAPLALQRTLLKKLVLTALNARNRQSAFKSFRDSWPKNHLGKSMTDKELDALLAVFLEQSPFLTDLMFADQGIRLMNVDAQIAERVHRHFTQQGVPVLSVHDSFIVDYTRVGELKRAMADASAAVVGRALPVSWTGVGLDEVDDEARGDLREWREQRVTRTDGYRARKAEWETRMQQEVIPWR